MHRGRTFLYRLESPMAKRKAAEPGAKRETKESKVQVHVYFEEVPWTPERERARREAMEFLIQLARKKFPDEWGD